MLPKKFALDSEFEEDYFHSLYALHTGAEGYLLAFKLNQFLCSQFKYCSEVEENDLLSSPFERYLWQPQSGDLPWELIANCRTHIDAQSTIATLFGPSVVEEKNYLIDAMKQVDFWLKIPVSTTQKHPLESLEMLEEIQLAYEVSDQKITQNPNLIFD